MRKFDVKKPEHAIHYLSNYGPWFWCGSGIYLCDKFLTMNDNVEQNDKYFSNDIQNDTELTGESRFGWESWSLSNIIFKYIIFKRNIIIFNYIYYFVGIWNIFEIRINYYISKYVYLIKFPYK